MAQPGGAGLGRGQGQWGQKGALTLAKCLTLAQTSLSHLEGGSPLQGPAEAGLGWGLGGPST